MEFDKMKNGGKNKSIKGFIKAGYLSWLCCFAMNRDDLSLCQSMKTHMITVVVAIEEE